MTVWGEMTFEYTMVVTESIRRMLQALPKGARRDKLKERALTPKPDGATTWKFPVTFKMTSSLGFWKSRIAPRLGRKVERDMLQAAIPNSLNKRAAGGEEAMAGKGEVAPQTTANSFRSMYHVGRKLTFQEQRDSIPYSPQISGKWLCWDFSSWSGCPLGKECPRLHQTMKLQGLHWLILAQLARRGGHVSRTRIPPEGVDGYIQALREASAKTDYGSGKMKWQPKSEHTASGECRKINPAIGDPPSEFVEIDLTEMEQELESVLYATDAWVLSSPDAKIDWSKVTGLTPEQVETQDWWDASGLPVHGALDTHILNDLVKQGKPFRTNTAEATLRNLACVGCEKEKRLAEQALIDLKRIRDGKQQAEGVLWGIRREWGLFVGQDMKIGSLRFDVVDFGENIVLSNLTLKLTGAGEKREKNQRVMLHWGEAMSWQVKGRGKKFRTEAASTIRQWRFGRRKRYMQRRQSGKLDNREMQGSS